jgi:4-hydroxy-tetrahydrodipicolinate reductase
MSQLKIGVMGCGGRMGRAIAREVMASRDVLLVGGTVRAISEHVGMDLGEVIGLKNLNIKVVSDPQVIFEKADVVIDFTHPDTLNDHLKEAVRYKRPLVLGTTGLSEEQLIQLQESAKSIPVLYSSNMSLGVALVKKYIAEAAKFLGKETDVEVLDHHHRHKKDAPSGTALELVRTVCEARGTPFEYHIWGQTYEGIRPKGAIGVSVIRGGEEAGIHELSFFMENEQITFTHKAQDRSIFAKGAIKAAAWLASQKPGLYTIQDVLGV